jgi:lipopolysaccharide export system permease protein
MTFGRTLGFYFALRFLKTVLAVFLLCVALIWTVNYVELARRTLYLPDVDSWRIAAVTMLRTPAVAEQALPFALLFGAIAAFVLSNRRLELVIARAAGVSAWQFLLPAAVTGILIGILATTVYNPVASALFERSLSLDASMFGRASSGTLTQRGPVWLRQDGNDGESIIRADESRNNGLNLIGATAFIFSEDGTFRERVEAPLTELKGDTWEFDDATVLRSGESPIRTETYKLNTFLTQAQAQEALAATETVSFWALPRFIQIAELAGLPAQRFRLQYHLLLSRPILLLAMVLIAGAVTLRFTRVSGLGGMILTGVVAGFVLYVVNELARDLGLGGLVSPALAAWLPAIVAILISMTVLLRQEDG